MKYSPRRILIICLAMHATLLWIQNVRRHPIIFLITFLRFLVRTKIDYATCVHVLLLLIWNHQGDCWGLRFIYRKHSKLLSFSDISDRVLTTGCCFAVLFIQVYFTFKLKITVYRQHWIFSFASKMQRSKKKNERNPLLFFYC